MSNKLEHMVTIPRTVYEQLQRDSRILEALYAGGVDNWERYDDAMDLLSDDDSGMAYDC